MPTMTPRTAVGYPTPKSGRGALADAADPVMVCPEALSGDPCAGVPRHPDRVVTAVDADVVDRAGTATAEREEDQVTRPFGGVRHVPRPLVLRRGVMWQTHPNLAVHVLDEAGAVERVRSGGTPHVWLPPLMRSDLHHALTERCAVLPVAMPVRVPVAERVLVPMGVPVAVRMPVAVCAVAMGRVVGLTTRVMDRGRDRGSHRHQPERRGGDDDQSAARSAGQGRHVSSGRV